MIHYLRANFGTLLLSVFGGVLATWLAQVFPSPVADGAWWRNLFFQPVPAVVLVSYSVILVVALLAMTNRWREADQARHADEREVTQGQVKVPREERDSLRKQLALAVEKSVTREALMRFVAVVLSDSADPTPKTHLHVCKSVAGLAGDGVPHSEIGEALGTMLQIGAVRPNYRELELASDWQGKLIQFAGKPRGCG
jgi:hypothetical protein